MTHGGTVSLPRLIVGIGAFVLVGFPLVAYLWATLNQLMAGKVRAGQLLALPAALLLAGLLFLLGRVVRHWEVERQEGGRP